MTGVDVAAIRARADAATEGPWVLFRPDSAYTEVWVPRDNATLNLRNGQIEKRDAEFIAHARTDVPALLDRLAEAERQRDDALALCASFDPTSGSGRARAFVGDLRALLSATPTAETVPPRVAGIGGPQNPAQGRGSAE